MKLRMKFRDEDLHPPHHGHKKRKAFPFLITMKELIVGIFEQFCCFEEVFLMALTSTEQLFIERPLHKCFLHNDRLPYFQ